MKQLDTSTTPIKRLWLGETTPLTAEEFCRLKEIEVSDIKFQFASPSYGIGTTSWKRKSGDNDKEIKGGAARQPNYTSG
jgi:hypothetical protein